MSFTKKKKRISKHRRNKVRSVPRDSITNSRRCMVALWVSGLHAFCDWKKRHYPYYDEEICAVVTIEEFFRKKI